MYLILYVYCSTICVCFVLCFNVDEGYHLIVNVSRQKSKLYSKKLYVCAKIEPGGLTEALVIASMFLNYFLMNYHPIFRVPYEN